MTKDYAYLALIQMQISRLPEVEQAVIARMAEELNAILNAEPDKAIAAIAITLVCAHNLIEITNLNEQNEGKH